MKKLCLYYFSGTGMTKYIVEKLISEFEKHGVVIDCFKIEDANDRTGSLTDYDILGIAYPVHSFNAPKIVIDFAKRLQKTAGMNTFIIHTAGEEHKINYAASDLLIRILSKRGYLVFLNKLIEMPSNFVVKYDGIRVKGILEKANKDMPNLANDIMELRHSVMQKSLGSRIIALLGRVEWLGTPAIGKFYYSDKSCVLCEHCIKSCPNKNIAVKKKTVRFK